MPQVGCTELRPCRRSDALGFGHAAGRMHWASAIGNPAGNTPGDAGYFTPSPVGSKKQKTMFYLFPNRVMIGSVCIWSLFV